MLASGLIDPQGRDTFYRRVIFLLRRRLEKKAEGR